MSETLNTTFQFINAIGSLGTVGTFVFLFRRDKDKQAQIDRLTDIATMLEAQNDTMKKQLRLSIEALLWTNGGGYNGSTEEFIIDLNNKGESAMIQNIVNNTTDVILTNTSFPYEIEKGANRKIFGRPSGEKHIKDCDIDIDVIYTDRLKNRFLSNIKGTGMHIKIVDTKEI